MVHFINLALTDLNEDGEPLVSVDESWINLDQIIEIIPMLGNNLVRRHSLGGTIPAEYYPLVQLSFSETNTRLISLGTSPDAAHGIAAIEEFMPTLISATNSTLDRELVQLLEAEGDE